MTERALSPDQIATATETLLGTPVDSPPQMINRGYGNDNWRVRSDGRDLLIKIDKTGFGLDKIQAASRAQALAAQAGVPVPIELAFDPRSPLFDERTVRIATFIPGSHPADALQSAAAVEPFFTSLGRNLARLHTVRFETFSSRVGGQPTFPTWGEYVRYRVPQILGRARSSGAFDERELTEVFAEVVRVADETSPVITASLVHRDLYLDNLLIAEDGTHAGFIDFDIAECWDPLVDSAKLRWQVFPVYAGAEDAFWSGYLGDSTEPADRWRRVWVGEVLELTNHAANATLSGKDGFAHSALRRLRQVLDGS